MKVVHQIYGRPVSTCTGRAYATHSSHRGEWQGMSIDAMATWTNPYSKEEESLYIEGDLRRVRLLLNMLLQQFDMLEKIERERFDKHGNGYGDRCMGGRMP